MSEQRIPAPALEYEPCEVEGCPAPNGFCANNYGGGYSECPRGPCRNWADKVERRVGADRREPTAPSELVEALNGIANIANHLNPLDPMHEAALRWAQGQLWDSVNVLRTFVLGPHNGAYPIRLSTPAEPGE